MGGAHRASDWADWVPASRPRLGTCYVQVLLGDGPCADGCTLPSILVWADERTYLFNVFDGFQRACNEHKVKVTKVSQIWATRTSSEALAGLPGLLLTLQGAGNGDGGSEPRCMRLNGPPGLGRSVQRNEDTGFGLMPDALQLVVREADPADPAASPWGVGTATEVDDLLRVTSITLSIPTGKHRAQFAKRPRLESLQKASPSLVTSYLIETPPGQGKFDPHKAAALGVPKGPLFGRLQRGESVTLPDGTQVESDQVCGPGVSSTAVAILDIPELACLEEARVKFDAFGNWVRAKASQEKGREVAVVVHLAHVDVIQSPEYASWAAEIGPAGTVRHLAAHPSCRGVSAVALPSTFLSSDGIMARLNVVDPDVFPVGLLGKVDSSASLAPGDPLFSVAGNLARYVIRPVKSLGLDTSLCPTPVHPQELVAEMHRALPGLRGSLETLRAGREQGGDPSRRGSPAQTSLPDSITLTFLGTGSAVPSKYRGSSAILMKVCGEAKLLMDCGEGTLGQLTRAARGDPAGPHSVAGMLRSLSCIWISHMHADHRIGLPSLLSARAKLCPDADRIAVVGPRYLRAWLAHFADVDGFDFAFTDCFDTRPGSLSEKSLNADSLRAMLERCLPGFVRFQSVPVHHCAHSYALCIWHGSGWSMCYSGDTRPCQALVDAARGCSVLVHEATFEAGMDEDARKKRHSTVSEALSVARQCGAEHTLLTHFSQRYPKFPSLQDHGGAEQVKWAVAFDLMEVDLGRLADLPPAIPVIQDIFEYLDGLP